MAQLFLPLQEFYKHNRQFLAFSSKSTTVRSIQPDNKRRREYGAVLNPKYPR